MKPPGWPAQVVDPDDCDFVDSATRWLWDTCSLERSADSVWSAYPVALAFRVSCDLQARIEGARTAYARIRSELADTDVPIARALSGLEAEGAIFQRLQREAELVAEALAGQRWGPRL